MSSTASATVGCGGSSSSNPYVAYVCSFDPIGYWRLGDAFDSSVLTDSSGNGYNGEYKNGARGTNCPTPACFPVYGITGDGSTVAMFTGKGTYAYANNVPAPRYGYTMDIWFQSAAPPSATTGPQMLFEQGGAGTIWLSADGQIHFRESQNFPDSEISSSASPTDPGVSAFAPSGASWWLGTNTSQFSKLGYNIGVFHHVVAVYSALPCDGTNTFNQFLYEQDNPGGTGATGWQDSPGTTPDLLARGCTQDPISGSGTLYLGYGDQGTWFNGYLDEAAYWAGPLSASQITQLTNYDPPFNKPRSAASGAGSGSGSTPGSSSGSGSGNSSGGSNGSGKPKKHKKHKKHKGH